MPGHTDELVSLDSSGNLKASGYKITEREAVSVAAGASAVSLTMAVNKMYTIDLTGAASAVTLTLAANKTGIELTKENVWSAKVKVPAGTTVTLAWDSSTSGGTVAWANSSAPAFTAGKTTEICIDLAIGNTNFQGASTEYTN